MVWVKKIIDQNNKWSDLTWNLIDNRITYNKQRDYNNSTKSIITQVNK